MDIKDTKTNYDLDVVASIIAEKGNSKAIKDTKFGLEYLIPNISEEQLIEVGFKFKEYSSYHRCPTYEMGNIYALYNDTVLHIMVM